MADTEQPSASRLNDDASSSKPNSAASGAHTSPQDSSGGIKGFEKRTKSKFKRALRIDETKDQLKDTQDGVLSKIKNDASFSPTSTLHDESSIIGQIKERLPDSAHELAHMIRHPQEVAGDKP